MSSSKVEPPSRTALRSARRVIVKAGTSVVTNGDGRPSLTRLGAIAEQISELVHSGTEVIFVSSGAVGMGKRLLRKQRRMKMSFSELQSSGDSKERSNSFDQDFHLNGGTNEDKKGVNSSRGLIGSTSFGCLLEASASRLPKSTSAIEKKKQYDSACAAAGQFEMMNFYSSLFGQCEIAASQILVTQADFQDEFRLKNLSYAIERLLSLGIVPIINENDAVSANTGYTADDVFSDNDSLAAICARNFNAEVLLLLTDVDGVYDRPPSEKDAQMLKFYHHQNSNVQIGEKSSQGELS